MWVTEGNMTPASLLSRKETEENELGETVCIEQIAYIPSYVLYYIA